MDYQTMPGQLCNISGMQDLLYTCISSITEDQKLHRQKQMRIKYIFNHRIRWFFTRQKTGLTLSSKLIHHLFITYSSQTNMLNINNIKNSTVLVRVNYDLPDPISTERIDDSLATLETLFENENKVILVTHWGRPKGVDLKLSTNNLIPYIEESLGRTVIFVNQYDGFENAKEFIAKSNEQFFILENTRFDKDEKSDQSHIRLDLATKYATLAHNYIDEAFAVSHRQEATNYEIKNILPNCLGLSYQNEITHLEHLKNKPKSPYIAIMGGAKLETKLPLLTKILPKVDRILVGGLLAFTFIQAANDLGLSKLEIFDSMVEIDYLKEATELLRTHGDKIILPIDLDFAEIDGKKYGFDIGPNTVKHFEQYIINAKTIFWNGPLGYCEKKPYDQGTLKIATIIANNKDSFKAIGGGDTGSAIPSNIELQFNFVSMGGGATLEYLSI
jgi:phosphoglycerate kinase